MEVDERAKRQALLMAQASGFMLHLEEEDQAAYVGKIIEAYEAAKAQYIREPEERRAENAAVVQESAPARTEQQVGRTELKPCPLCGNSNLRNGLKNAFCTIFGAEGPVSGNEPPFDWNNRATSTTQQPEPVSLKDCAMALQGNQQIKVGSNLKAIAKAVLDTAGVIYED